MAVGAAFAFAGAAPSAPPKGATALCRDGTYSFSKHHSGTCSRHGGVKKWLDGSGTNGGTRISVGQTVLLASRTRDERVQARPEPGSPLFARRVLQQADEEGHLRQPSFRTSAIRNVPQSEKFAVEREYGMAERRYGRTLEIDHIVSLELGGSNDIANLFPEKLNAAPGYKVKDRLENKLHDWVCAGKIGLRPAQRQIAGNWQALYRKVFGVAPA